MLECKREISVSRVKAACRRDDLSRDVDDQGRAPRGSIAAGTRELLVFKLGEVVIKRQNMALQGLLYRL